MPSLVPTKKISINAVALASPYKHLREQQQKNVENFDHSSCTRNGDHVGLLVKISSTKIERMMPHSSVRTF